MFSRNPEVKAQKAAKKAGKKAEKQALREWRSAHPQETTMRVAATLQPWPKPEYGVTRQGPVLGGKAEFFNAGAHKGWTATRLVAGAATMGTSAFLTGRKSKGAAAINIVYGNGASASYDVSPDSGDMSAANRYITAFNALAAQLAAEQTQG